jgi:hypothetical protein
MGPNNKTVNHWARIGLLFELYPTRMIFLAFYLILFSIPLRI